MVLNPFCPLSKAKVLALKATVLLLLDPGHLRLGRERFMAQAIPARLPLIPNLTDDNLSGLAWPIRDTTALAIPFVVLKP